MKNTNKNKNNYLSGKTNLFHEKHDREAISMSDYAHAFYDNKNTSTSSSRNYNTKKLEKDWLELEYENIELDEGGRI